jgi:cyclic pyranopterin phosphate synthase
MVDVSSKEATERVAVAEGFLRASPETLRRIVEGTLPKGDFRPTVQLAGIAGAKRASELIPLCHPLPLTHVAVRVEFTETPPGVEITASASCIGRTGVEMEALTAASVAALTVYDMVKGLERGVRIAEIRLIEKHGGSSGDYLAE